jgi:arsenical pump membrane protein
MWRWVSGAALLALLTGLLPLDAAADVTRRIAPILLFLVAITVLAELCEVAGLFDVAARYAAQAARGRASVLFLLVAALATVTTILLGLDTTAVLLTPVVLATAVQLDLPPMPFALLTVWLANTASLLLPVSNLTNLLALDRLDLSAPEFATRMWLPELVAVVLTVGVIGLRHRRLLHVRYAVPHRPTSDDVLLLAASACACLGIVPAILLGAEPTPVLTVAAAALALVFAAHRRSALRPALVPWRLAVLVLGLALVVEAVLRHGGNRLVPALVGSGDGLPDLLRLAGVGAGASNLVNNLPAYLVVEPHVAAGDGDVRLLALLLGTNLGPMVLLWGSLATLLWRERLRARGLDVSARSFAAFGALGVPLVLVASTLALHATA